MAASAVDVGRGLEVESTTHVRELRKFHADDMLVTRSFFWGGGGEVEEKWHLRSEVTVEVKGATDGLESWEVDRLDDCVICHLETTADRLQLRERHVSHIRIADQRERAADGRKVRSRDAGEEVGEETHGAVD